MRSKDDLLTSYFAAVPLNYDDRKQRYEDNLKRQVMRHGCYIYAALLDVLKREIN